MVLAFDIDTSRRLLTMLAVSRVHAAAYRIGNDVGEIARVSLIPSSRCTC
jgi:hypothetical protein